MAKILVADDNSNVQKTVTLALAELGIEVVSVNNGEAAVRKLTDISPDLVLADIFMPVRNGYEVCEYVKKDPRFSHVPVVLLVGAFDPLDEREAQRVGADGILKKPFVPPDPLIAMVKTLLDRTMGERLVAVTAVAAKPAPATVSKPAAASTSEEHSPRLEAADDNSIQEFAPAAGRVTFQDGAHPVAFGQLLETPLNAAIEPAIEAVEPVDNDLVLTSSRDATLGDPIFWRNDSPEPETETESPQDDSAGLELRTWTQGEDSLPRRDESALLQPLEPLELVREEPDEASQAVVSSQSILLDQAAQAPLNVESDIAPELAANPIEWMATAPAEPLEEPLEATPRWDEPLPETTDLVDVPELPDEQGTSPISLPDSDRIPAPVAESAQAEAQPDEGNSGKSSTELAAPKSHPVSEQFPATAVSSMLAQPEAIPADNVPEPSDPQTSVRRPVPSFEATSLAISKNGWADLTVTLPPEFSEADSQEIEPSSQPAASSLSNQPEVKVADKISEPGKTYPAPRSLLQSVEDTARSIPKHDWADLVSALPSSSSQPPPSQPSSEANAPSQVMTVAASQSTAAIPAPASPPDAALVEAVVQRVMDKMRPQVVDIITKEFLRPIVQALVNREIEKH